MFSQRPLTRIDKITMGIIAAPFVLAIIAWDVASLFIDHHLPSIHFEIAGLFISLAIWIGCFLAGYDFPHWPQKETAPNDVPPDAPPPG